MSTWRRLTHLAVVAFLAGGPAFAQGQPSTLTLDRIFAAREFDRGALRAGPLDGRRRDLHHARAERRRPTPATSSATTPPAAPRGCSCPAAKLVPAGARRRWPSRTTAGRPTASVLLVFTNTAARLAAEHPRRLLGARPAPTAALRKLGGDAEPSTLMFAKFSPDGRASPTSRENNLYVEDLGRAAITPAHRRTADDDHQRHLRLGLRGGVRPARRLPLEPRRQVDRLLAVRHARREGVLPRSTTPTRSIPTVNRFKYPKAGETNSAVPRRRRPGAGGHPVWMKTPGDPREHYIPRMEWAGNSHRGRPPAAQPAPEHRTT